MFENDNEGECSRRGQKRPSSSLSGDMHNPTADASTLTAMPALKRARGTEGSWMNSYHEGLLTLPMDDVPFGDDGDDGDDVIDGDSEDENNDDDKITGVEPSAEQCAEGRSKCSPPALAARSVAYSRGWWWGHHEPKGLPECQSAGGSNWLLHPHDL